MKAFSRELDNVYNEHSAEPHLLFEGINNEQYDNLMQLMRILDSLVKTGVF